MGSVSELPKVVCWELETSLPVGDICWSGCLCIGQDGQVMLEEGQGLCMWSSVSFGG